MASHSLLGLAETGTKITSLPFAAFWLIRPESENGEEIADKLRALREPQRRHHR